MGRFKTIRKLYKIFKINKKQTLIIDSTNEEYINSDLNENLIINEIDKNGFYNNIQLNHTTLNYIKNLCSRSEMVSALDGKKFNSISQVDNYNNTNEKPCCLLDIVNPELDQILKKISRDKRLLNIANNYLGKVNNIDAKIQFSPVCDATDKWREISKQTVTFHYDVHNLNFLYVFFYLTDCDKVSGAHELIKKSHNKKFFFKHLIGSVKQSRISLENDYNINDFIIIEGHAGHGFIEDTSCYHRALKPIKKPRLAMQFRYY